MSRFALLALLVPTLALAGELKGVTLPDQQEVAGKALKLNGMGVRRKIIFNVYVAGLYVETPGHDADALSSANEVRRVQMHMLRDVEKATMAEAISKGFRDNNSAQMSMLEERLGKLLAAVPDLAKGDDVLVTCIPGEGTKLAVKGRDAITIPGKDFSDAMLRVWLGQKPVDAELKDGLLGK